jgi:hypothetical protein
MPRSPLDNDGSIAKDIKVFVVNDDCFRIAQDRLGWGLGHTGRRVSKHRVALRLLHQPRRARELACIGGVIIVVVGKGVIA